MNTSVFARSYNKASANRMRYAITMREHSRSYSWVDIRLEIRHGRYPTSDTSCFQLMKHNFVYELKHIRIHTNTIHLHNVSSKWNVEKGDQPTMIILIIAFDILSMHGALNSFYFPHEATDKKNGITRLFSSYILYTYVCHFASSIPLAI